MATYASKSAVSSEQSRIEVERTLRRYGAGKFGYMTEDERAVIMFELDSRRYRFVLPLPHPREFKYTPSRRRLRSESAIREAYGAAIRQRWRALALLVKATLEAVESGIITLEEALLSQVVLPDNTTVGERMIPRLDAIASSGELPPLLPMPSQFSHDA